MFTDAGFGTLGGDLQSRSKYTWQGERSVELLPPQERRPGLGKLSICATAGMPLQDST